LKPGRKEKEFSRGLGHLNAVLFKNGGEPEKGGKQQLCRGNAAGVERGVRL